MTDTDTEHLALLRSLTGRSTPSQDLPDDVAGWVPQPIEVPEPRGLRGFGPLEAPEVVGNWFAQARRWATGDGSEPTPATKYAAILRSKKTWDTTYGMWETLMALHRDQSRLLPVPWAWWRIKENPKLGVMGCFSASVLQIPWQRAKFWDDHPKTFQSRPRLMAKVTRDLSEMCARARVTGMVDLARWSALRDEEAAQRQKILLRLQQVWMSENLVLWLGSDAALLAELKVKKFATASV